MNRFLLFISTLIFSVAVLGQADSVYSDVEAAAKAKQMLKDALAMRNEVTELCVSRNTQQLYKAADKADEMLNQWPDDHLKYRALFPYSDCRQSMLDIQAYAMVCAIGGYKGEAATYDQRRWQEDTAACEAAIIKPDLSLTEIE